MNQTKLSKAREHEEKYGAKISPQERPMFHITPTAGWLNDPNGFSVYKGEYHIFYQYNPYDINWNTMHWGHSKSSDFIKWERLPAALSPDEEYDEDGVFSGSAIEMPDGCHLLLYTGVHGEERTPDCRQTQCVAYGDGVDYKKYENNPVITMEGMPEDFSRGDFRDPKIWRDNEEDCYFAVVGSRVSDGSGAVLLFSSKDTTSWKYVSTLDRSDNQYGKMWECPDLFKLNEKAVILISPQEMKAKGLDFHNGNDVICIVGNYDKKSHAFTREKVLAVDYGLDFYAPQTLKTPDGRRVMIAWMQSWESSRFHPEGAKWAGMLTIPRELSLEDGRLVQNPVRELLKYRKNSILHKDVLVEGRRTLPGVSGRLLDMTVEIRPDAEGMFKSFAIYFAQNDEYQTFVSYDSCKNRVCLDRTDSGFRYNIVNRREAPARDRNGSLKLRILLDRFSVEAFINDGEQAMSAVIYTPQEADGISFEADGKVWMDVEKWEIEV